MNNLHFIILDNSRLDFKDTSVQVKSFINSRLDYFNVSSVSYVESNTMAEERIAALIKDGSDGFIVFYNILRPIIDLDLVDKMCDRLGKYHFSICYASGAIPGTEPEFVNNKKIR